MFAWWMEVAGSAPQERHSLISSKRGAEVLGGFKSDSLVVGEKLLLHDGMNLT